MGKPGYGTFAEAACNGTPMLYARRPDWPEQEALIPWLQAHAVCREVEESALQVGDLGADLAALWQQPVPPRPHPRGALQVAACLHQALGG